MVRARSFHRWLGLGVAVPLALIALTGLTYRLGRSWFGLDDKVGWAILDLHSGEFLGDEASAFYLLAVGVALLALIAFGLRLLFQPGSRTGLRRLHRVLGVVATLPLLTSVTTGLAYKLGEEWFGIPDETQDALMRIHQGAWLGPRASPYYVLLLGLGVLVLIGTGLRFALRKRRAH